MIRKLQLSREAILFDSPLYLFKTFLGVMISYLIFSHHAIIGKDMISVLFGMMLSLEPVNISGIKSGIAQFEATLLGGLVTAVIISIAGVTFITVPLAVMMTLYISILLDWKNISPVAFFTSIYMTQLIQYTADGQASMLLTFRLRIMALGAGVIVAIVLNFIFSLLFYKSMVRKRSCYLFEKMSRTIKAIEEILSDNKAEKIVEVKRAISCTFTDIDFVYGHVQDMGKEKQHSNELEMYTQIMSELRLFNHYLFDMVLELESTWSEATNRKYLEEFKVLRHRLTCLSQLDKSCDDAIYTMEAASSHYKKLWQSLDRIKASMH